MSQAWAETLETGYASAWDHLRDELRRLDLVLSARANQERRRPEDPLDRFRGLVVSDQRAQMVLADLLAPSGGDEGPPVDAAGEWSDALQSIERQIANRIARTTATELPLVTLSRVCGLTSFEAQCLVICLAPEVDRRYETLYGYLQNDVTRRRPTVSLVLDLLCGSLEDQLAARMFFDADAPLLRCGLCRIDSAYGEGALPLLARGLSLDDRIVDLLLGRPRIDARLGDAVHLSAPAAGSQSLVDEDLPGRIQELHDSHETSPDDDRHHPVFHLYGPEHAAKRAVAQEACRRLDLPLLVADLGRLLNGPVPFGEAVRLLAREALLLPAALCLENFDALLRADADKRSNDAGVLLDACRRCARLTFLLGVHPWLPETLDSSEPFFAVEVKLPDLTIRRRMWEQHADFGLPLSDDVDWGSLASRFRLGPVQVRDVLVAAGNLATWRSPADPRLTLDDLNAACRAIGATRLTSLARRIEGRDGWNDLVLPPNAVAQLMELCDQAEYRHVVFGDWGFESKLPFGRGLSALFSGPPGTGKTMAAQVVAGALGLDLHRIDLSQVVSKYIGDTEKNLRQVFEEAEVTQAILFFDEADALFGKRSEVKDAHDRYANVEVGYLLQKMEEFEGIAILATNARQNLDEAFVRRLRFVIEFPFPDEEHRRRIWQVTFPALAPLAGDIDFGALAREVRLSGGHIRNIGLAAAFAAASDGGVIHMRHRVHASRREFEKLGRSWGEGAAARVGRGAGGDAVGRR